MRFLSVLLTLVAALHARAQDDIFTPRHIAKLRIVTEAAIAPDGKQVAYVLAVPRDIAKEKDGPSWTELHVVDMVGNSTPIITGAVNVAKISWMPDGQGIAFLARRANDVTHCLYAVAVRGGVPRKLVAHATDIQQYSFSGDGKSLAFLAAERAPAARKKQREQGFNQKIFESDQPLVRVYVCSFDKPGDAPTEPAQMIELEGSASELQFHPKLNKIAIALAPAQSRHELRTFRKIHLVEISSGRTTQLGNLWKPSQLAWSPDGKMVAAITGHNQHDPKEGRLVIMEAAGGREKFGTAQIQNVSHFESFAWKRSTEIWSQGINRTWSFLGIHRVVNDQMTHQYVRPRSGAILEHITISSRANAVAFIAHHPTHPPEVYCATTQKIEPRRLTDSNPWLKKMRFARQEVVKFTAGDGRELEGMLIRPLNEKKGQRYPLIVQVHDGPADRYAHGWLTTCTELGQVAAARGMAVFYPNYRGSTGYGVTFSMQGQADVGGNEFYDLIDGVGHLVDTGLVDKKKVGITGAAYGGYGAAWGATHYSEHFAAAVSFGGISDWVSYAGTTGSPHADFLTRHRKWLWDDWDYFAKISPLKHLARAKTPLLIAHGKEDTRIPPSQSLEIYRHLKLRGQAPVRLVFYPGEGHRLNRTASRLDYSMRLLQWMEHYLKGPGGSMPSVEIDYGIQK